MKLKIILFVVLLIGCSKTEKTPKYVIPTNDFVSIVVDIHLLDGMMNEVNIRRKITKNDTVDLYSEIFKNYGYTRKDFDTSIYYYSSKINTYDEIYKEVLNKLNKMETQLKEEEEKEKRENKKAAKEEIAVKEINSYIGIFYCYPSYLPCNNK